jgi:DNA ligase-1
MATPFTSFSDLCEALEATTKRNEKKLLISEFLQKLDSEEVVPTISFLIGKPFPESDERVLEVGGRTLWRLGESGQATLIAEPLTILEVSKTFDAIAKATGPGSRAKKEALLEGLLRRATSKEAKYLLRILTGEMRIGAVEGVAMEGISEASKADLKLVQRANMLLGNLGEVAEIALAQGAEGLKRVGLRLFNPVKPMLAEMSYDLGEVFEEHGDRTALEWKFDGARIQVHKRGDNICIFSRRLSDVTESLPDMVALARKEIHVEETLVEGEAVAIGEGERPLPFQDLMRRFRRVHDVEAMVREIPLRLYLFDILYLDGELLIDQPYSRRWQTLEKTVDASLLAPRIVTSSIEEAKEFLDTALKAGHEGLMAKALYSEYTPGVRGKKWFKIKPFETLDLVIIAADWGYGRREGWLSNYHLGALDEETGEFLSLGKTFKGLTDEEFETMTRRLQSLKVLEDEYTVYVKPSVIVEVAYNEIQHSPRYKSGFALRFARILRIRDDKGLGDVDTLKRVRTLYRKQFEVKARLRSVLT